MTCDKCGSEIAWARTIGGALKAVNVDVPTQDGDVVLVALVDNGEMRVLSASFAALACAEERYSFHVCPEAAP